jgi:acetolactate synthase-1/2/3 large subunit
MRERSEPTKRPDEAVSVAGAYLAQLADRGIDFLFGNAGTDFGPIVEALARAARRGTPVPRPIIAAHENVAVSMAHGYAMVSGKIPAVMVHVSVGTANAVCAAMNAARENVAILLTAGRTPITEAGQLGSRDGYIHWAQEMYDQAGMVREFVKWDYELRNAEQLETVVDRALAIAGTEPRGPVYLTLPREIIAAPASQAGYRSPGRLNAAAPAAPDVAAIATAAEMLAAAQRPIIITANAGRDHAAFAALAAFADRFAIPVVQHRPRYLSLPSAHAMGIGFDPARFVGDADLILVLESDVPWIPSRAVPGRQCRVIQCGFDPLFSRYPVRGFPCDLGITGGAAAILTALAWALDSRVDAAAIAARRSRVERARAALTSEWQAARDSVAGQSPIDPIWVSHCLDRAKDDQSIVINEYSLLLEHCTFQHAGSYFGSSSASGLGWAAGAALGAKLATPERMVVAVVGDGAYMFSNPVAVHHAAALHGLPVLFVIMNNSMWGAVRRSTLAMYPDGQAAASNDPSFIRLGNLPAFEQVCAAAGGYGERVEDPAALPAAFDRAISAVRDEKRQALLNLVCKGV